MSDVSYLSHARYGKDKVRVLRVVRDGPWHTVVEYNVKALVEGDIDVRFVSRRPLHLAPGARATLAMTDPGAHTSGVYAATPRQITRS